MIQKHVHQSAESKSGGFYHAVFTHTQKLRELKIQSRAYMAFPHVPYKDYRPAFRSAGRSGRPAFRSADCKPAGEELFRFCNSPSCRPI